MASGRGHCQCRCDCAAIALCCPSLGGALRVVGGHPAAPLHVCKMCVGDINFSHWTCVLFRMARPPSQATICVASREQGLHYATFASTCLAPRCLFSLVWAGVWACPRGLCCGCPHSKLAQSVSQYVAPMLTHGLTIDLTVVFTHVLPTIVKPTG